MFTRKAICYTVKQTFIYSKDNEIIQNTFFDQLVFILEINMYAESKEKHKQRIKKHNFNNIKKIRNYKFVYNLQKNYKRS